MNFRTLLPRLCGLSALLWALSAQAEPARVIVQFKSAAQAQAVSTSTSGASGTSGTSGTSGGARANWLGQRHGLSLSDGRVIDGHRQVVLGSGDQDASQLAETLRQDPAVEWAVPDRRRHAAAYPSTAPNDPLFPTNSANNVAAGQWYLRAPTSTFVSAINAQPAWATSTGRGIVVADIDTGVLFNHPDLIGKFYAGYDFVSESTHNHDGTGVDADAADPGDWATAKECGLTSIAERSSWHGTQTSSVIAAHTNNGVGMAGVAPDVMILPLRVLANCGGWDSDIMAAMLWAAGLPTGLTQATNPHPAKVLNMSLGSSADATCPSSYQSVVDQLLATGVVIVVSAGNDEGLRVSSPGNCPGVIGVAGLRHAGTKVGFSNVGPEIALSAPGGNCVTTNGPCQYTILTATSTGTQGPGDYTYSSTANAALGTSFSAPMVAGAAALMLSRNPDMTPAQVKSLLQSSARTFPSAVLGVSTCHAPDGQSQDECVCTTSTCGAGMLDVATAVEAANPDAQPAVSVTPSATTALVGANVSLNGAASVVPTGRAVQSRAWTISSGSNLASFSGATNASAATLHVTAPGFVAVSFTLTDNLGVSATRTTWLAVSASSAASASVQLNPASVLSGNTVVASGAASTGTDSNLSYAWQILQGGDLVNVTGGTTGPTLTLQTLPNVSGTVSVGLTVTDGAGHIASKVAEIAVLPAQPTVLIGATSTNVDLGQTIILDGGGSTAVNGRSVASYNWSLAQSSAAAGFGSGTTFSTTSVVPAAIGTVSVVLTVTDNLGSTGSKQLDLTVLSAAAQPTAVISSTSNEVAVGQSLVLDAGTSVVQPGRPIASYQWRILSGSALGISGDSHGSAVTLSGLTVGSAVVQVTVVDDHGKSSSATTSVTVSPAKSLIQGLTGGTSGGGGAAGLADLLALLGVLALAVWRSALARRQAPTLS